MKVLNIHTRIINESKENFSKLLETLATKHDKIWPNENWPMIHFSNGLNVGSKGGHGFIRYTIVEADLNNTISFKFTKPKQFYGTHSFTLKTIKDNVTKLEHTIKIRTAGIDTILWLFVIKHLHNALIEDCFDKIENQFKPNYNKKQKWSFWVKFLRQTYKSLRKFK